PDYRAAFRQRIRPDRARDAVYGSKGVAADQRRRIDHHYRVGCLVERLPWFRRVCGEQGGLALLRTHVAQRAEGQEYQGERAEPGSGRYTRLATARRADEADVR